MKRFLLSYFAIIASFIFAHAAHTQDSIGILVSGEFESVPGDSYFGQVDGGRVWGPQANLTVTGGEFRGGGVAPGDGIDIHLGGQVTVNGGVVQGTDDGIKLKADSTLTVNSGSISGGNDGLAAVGASTFSISGGEINGEFHGINASGHARGDWSGGRVNGRIALADDASLSISGGNVDNSIQVADRGTLKILGGNITGSVETSADAIVAVFLAEDFSSNQLFNGGSTEFGINPLADAYFVYGVTSDRIINTVENVSGLGVLDGPSGRPTTVQIRDGAFVSALYLAERSTGFHPAGSISDLVVDDESRYDISGGWISSQSRKQAALVTGHGQLNVSGGIVTSTSGDGIRVRGNGKLTATGGEISGARDGVDLTASAVATVNGASITGADEGILAKDQSSLSVMRGSIVGGEDGISATDTSVIDIRGGTISGGEYALVAADQAFAQLDGGTLQGRVVLRDESRLDMSGGTIDQDLVVTESSVVHLHGGFVRDDLRLAESASLKMLGGVVQGDIESRDDSRVEISGGRVGNLQAQEDSIIRIFGTGLQTNAGNITGRLLDGQLIQTQSLALDSARVITYEGIDRRSKVNSTQNHNVAVVGNGATVHVDFLEGAQVSGEVLASDDGRVNFFGGGATDNITLTGNGMAAFYGKDLTLSFQEGLVRVSGEMRNGANVDTEIQIESADTDVLVFETVEKTVGWFRRSFNNLAIMDGPTGPTTARAFGGAEPFGIVEVRENSVLKLASNVNTPAQISGWDSAVIEMGNGFSGAGVLEGANDGVFLHDRSSGIVAGLTVSGARDGVRVWDQSSLVMDRGRVLGDDDGIDVRSSGVVRINGGEILGADHGIRAKDAAEITVTSGSISGEQHGIALSGDARLVLDGENIQVLGNAYGIHAEGDAIVNVLNGTVDGGLGSVSVDDTALVQIRGGDLSGELLASGQGTIRVFGSNLRLNGTRLTGTLQDGTAINLNAVTRESGQILLDAITGRLCDFNQDGACDVADLDRLLYEGLPLNDSRFDIDGSGTVDLQDRDAWLAESGYVLGDFDFDNDVDSADLNTIGVAWTSTGATSYRSGDVDGNGLLNVVDLNAVGVNWQHGVGAAAVPEPDSVVLLAMIGLMLTIRRRRVS